MNTIYLHIISAYNNDGNNNNSNTIIVACFLNPITHNAAF